MVVARIDCRCDEGGSFRIGTGNSQEITTHDVGLGSDSDQTVDVLADRYQDLSCHVSAFLCSWCLVLDVNTSSTLLNEQFREFHDGCQSTVTGICISDDGSQVVNLAQLRTVGLGCSDALLALLSIVEQLRLEKVANLVGNGGLL